MPETARSGPGPAHADRSAIPARDFTLRSAFALSFSDISPIVGIYSVFAIGLIAAGPAFFWAFPVVLIGQMLVTGVFGDLVSKWPLQGSVYAWARQLVGPRYGWFTGWAYMWGLTLALSALSLAASAGIGTALLFFHRTNPFSVLFTAAGAGHSPGWVISPFLGVVGFGISAWVLRAGAPGVMAPVEVALDPEAS